MSHDFFVKTSDLVQRILENHENKDFYVNLLIERMDKAFEDPPPLSRRQYIWECHRKIPKPSVMDDSKDNEKLKGILIVASIIENFERILHCRQECWELAKAMYKLAKTFYRLKDFPILNHLHKIKNVGADPVLSTIVDASNACFFHKKEKKHDGLVLNPFEYGKEIKRSLQRVDVAHTDLGTVMLVQTLCCEQHGLCMGSGDDTRKILESTNVKEKTDQKRVIQQLMEEENNREQQVKQITKKLKLNSEKPEEKYVAVVIHGDSGECKTNLADAVYNRLEVELFFNGWKLCKKKMEFNPNVEELHSEIVNKLAGEKQNRKKHNGKEIRRSIQNELIFLCIENIIRAQDLIKILDMELMRPNKVRLLVTSANKKLESLLKECGFKCESHEATCVEDNHEDNAGRISNPMLRELVRAHLNKIKGHDKETVRKWVNEDDLAETSMKFSFEKSFLNLPAAAQDAFQDIRCFFLGWDWNEISHIVGEAELQTLEENAWVKRTARNQIAVPDSLLPKGQSLDKGVRITSLDEIKNILSSDDKEIKQIKGIWVVDNNELPQITLEAEKLELMTEVRVLSFPRSIVVKGKCTDKSLEKLRFLRVCRSSNDFFNIKHLRDLSYFKSDDDLQFDPSQLPPNLKVAILCGDEDFKYHRTSDNESHSHGSYKKKEWITWEIEDLRTLKVKYFHRLGVPDPKIFSSYDRLNELSISTSSVVELPESLSQLYGLEKLDLHDCKFLRKLPKSFGTLLHLAKLNLGYCSSLRHLSESFGQLQSLQELDLRYCLALRQLPASFVCLSALKKASFSHCRNMHMLPEKFELLGSLEEVDFSYCVSLKMLPVNFEMLYALQLLNLHGCRKLEKVPDSYPGSLFKSKSVAIKLSGCSSMLELQDEFFQGNEIEDLSLACCNKLQRIHSPINQLKRLRNLNLSRCLCLVQLPDSFSELTCLEMLNLSCCRKLKNLCKGFYCLEALKDLNLSHCPVLKVNLLKTVKRIQSLRIVDIRGSIRLINIWNRRWNQRQSKVTVITEEAMTEYFIEKILRETALRFFKNKAILVGKNGKPLFPSTAIEEGPLALIFDHNISRWDWELLENNVDKLLTELMGMQVIYVGKSFTRIPTKLADVIVAYTPDISEALSLFDKSLSINADTDFWKFRTYIVKTTVVVNNQLGSKQFQGWDSISGALLGKNFRIQDYCRLEEIFAIGSPQKGNLEVLQALFTTKENEELAMSRENTKVTIDSLQDNIVFLLISTPEISQSQISLLKEMYNEMKKTRHEYKVEWLWVQVTDADMKTRHENKEEALPWVVISDARLKDLSTMKTFIRSRMGFCEMPILVGLAPSGRVSATDVIPIVATMGSEACLFLNNVNSSSKGVFLNKVSAKDEEEVNNMKSLTHLRFLFKHFNGIGEKLSQCQMVWLYGGDPERISNFNAKLRSVRDKLDGKCIIQIVYVGRGRILGDSYSIKDEEAFYHENTDGIEWTSISFANVKRFWHHIHYLAYLIAYEKELKKMAIQEEHKKISPLEEELEVKKLDSQKENEIEKESSQKKDLVEKIEGLKEEAKKLENLQKLVLGLLSLDCLSRRNGTVWMMAVDGSSNEIFTGKGKELVDLLVSNIEDSKPSWIEIKSEIGKVYSKKTEPKDPKASLIKVIQTGSGNSSDVKDEKTIEDAPWFTAHPSSQLVEQISANMYCSMCCLGDTAYHCDMCGCFSVCQKCYISEFIRRSKNGRGEQIYIDSQ